MSSSSPGQKQQRAYDPRGHVKGFREVINSRVAYVQYRVAQFDVQMYTKGAKPVKYELISSRLQ